MVASGVVVVASGVVAAAGQLASVGPTAGSQLGAVVPMVPVVSGVVGTGALASGATVVSVVPLASVVVDSGLVVAGVSVVVDSGAVSVLRVQLVTAAVRASEQRRAGSRLCFFMGSSFKKNLSHMSTRRTRSKPLSLSSIPFLSSPQRALTL